MSKRRDYDGRYQKQPNFAGKNLRLGKIQAQEVERFVNLDKQYAFVQCWKCLSVQTIPLGRRCQYCDGKVEVLMIDGVPQP